MEEAERTEESAEDMTAADTAPRPKKEAALHSQSWSVSSVLVSLTWGSDTAGPSAGSSGCRPWGSAASCCLSGSSPSRSSEWPGMEAILVICDGFNKSNHLGDASNKYGRDGHQDTSECRQVREDFRRCRWFAGENPLEVDLPGDSTEGEEEEVVSVVPVPPPAADLSHPGLSPVSHLDRLDCRVDPGEWDTDPLERK